MISARHRLQWRATVARRSKHRITRLAAMRRKELLDPGTVLALGPESKKEREQQRDPPREERHGRIGIADCPRTWLVERDSRRLVVSGLWAEKEPAPVAHFGTVAELPAEFVTLLVPVEKGEQELGEIVRVEDSTVAKVSGYRYRTSSREDHYTVFGTAGEHWSLGPWRSDAEFMYWGVERDGLTRTLIFCKWNICRERRATHRFFEAAGHMV